MNIIAFIIDDYRGANAIRYVLSCSHRSGIQLLVLDDGLEIIISDIIIIPCDSN